MLIVLVDSSRVGLMVMSRLLEERGHSVVSFRDGSLALDHMRTHPDVDVLMTSFELQGLSGLELCWEVRAMANTDQRPIYVIAMSSSYDQEKLVEALDSGADDFILKPPNSQELSARLRAAERLNRAHAELIRLATQDPLTSLYNRRAFFEKANRVSTCATAMRPTAALMFDIDYFKRVNDGFGHDVGDAVIKSVAELSRRVLEPLGAVIGRLGGEEFGAVFENLDESGARTVAEELRRAVEAERIETGTVLLGITISVGVAVARTPDAVDYILKRADVALYQAKSNGRNRVVVDELRRMSEIPVKPAIRAAG